MKRIVFDENLETKLQKILDRFKNYDSFSGSIGSYEYSELINEVITFCPYCNIESIKTIRENEKEKGQRPDYDHFVPKNGTKEIDLNCKNLVPSCKYCNTNYKGSDDLSNTILNPFVDDFDTNAKFSLNITQDSLENIQDAQILLQTIASDVELANKAEETIKRFHLRNRYNDENVKTDLTSFLSNIELYPDIRRKDIDSLTKSEKRVLEQLKDVENSEINKSRYGKFKKDIYNNYVVNYKEN